jgi:hypothetical protein
MYRNGYTVGHGFLAKQVRRGFLAEKVMASFATKP